MKRKFVAPRRLLETDPVRKRLLRAMLAEVPFDGWTDAALVRARRAAKQSDDTFHLVAPRGVADLVAAFGDEADAAMMKRIKGNRAFDRLKTREKIAFAVRSRLEYYAPHREALRRLIIWYSLPHRLPLGFHRVAKTVDLCWRASGDRSTDFNYYTKRGLLAGVIKATLVFWLNDESEGSSESWNFLARRIDEVLRAGQMIGRLRA